MKKKLFKILAAGLIAATALSTSVYARDIDPTEFVIEDYVPINIIVNCDDSFTERMDFYIDGYRATCFDYNESKENNGYSGNMLILPGVHKFAVISSTDTTNIYSFEYPESIDTDKDTSVTVTVTQNEQTEEDDEYSGHGDDEDFTYEEPVITPMEYDFSDGKEAGTLHIMAKSYGAVTSLQYRLVGAERTYDILLDSDHAFIADVILPVGDYRESSSIEVELAEGAAARESVRFTWAHSDNPKFFGNTYTIGKDETVSVTDLMVNMTQDNEVSELNSQILFSDTQTRNRLAARDAHVQKELESAFPEIYGSSETETETIPTVETIAEANTEEDTAKGILIPAVACVAILGIGICGIIWFRRKK